MRRRKSVFSAQFSERTLNLSKRFSLRCRKVVLLVPFKGRSCLLGFSRGERKSRLHLPSFGWICLDWVLIQSPPGASEMASFGKIRYHRSNPACTGRAISRKKTLRGVSRASSKQWRSARRVGRRLGSRRSQALALPSGGKRDAAQLFI